MVNTELDIHICGANNGLPFWPISIYREWHVCVWRNTAWWYTYPSEKYEFVNGKGDIPYMKWKITHVWNQQPEYLADVPILPWWRCIEMSQRDVFSPDAENMNGIEVVNLEKRHKLVGGFNLPLWKIWLMWKSVGIMNFPIYGKS